MWTFSLDSLPHVPFQVTYVGLNVAQTLYELVRCGNEKKALALKTELKVSDTRYAF